MTCPDPFDQCRKYVEATKCPGNDTPPEVRVFVHEDNLPEETRLFRFLSPVTHNNCWTIDPSGPRVCLPKGAWLYHGPFDFEDCTVCEADDEEDGEGEPPDDGGNGQPPGGPWRPGLPPYGGGGWGGEGTPMGIKITVCAAHVARAQARGWDTDHLYWPRSDEFDHAFIANVGGICVQVPTGPVVTEPDPAYWVGGGGEYDNCSDCTDGYPAELCPDDVGQPGSEDAPAFYIRKGDYQGQSGFAWGAYCYTIGSAELIPENVRVINPDDLPCGECRRGVKYTVCPGEPDPPTDYWADQHDIDWLLSQFPDLTEVFIRIKGICHHLDLTAPNERMPLNATVVRPRCVYLDCDACKCGTATQPLCDGGPYKNGIPVYTCTGSTATNYWIEQANIPAQVTWFAVGKSCLYVDPSDEVTRIPDDAEVITISNTFPSCTTCMASIPPGSGGGGDPPEDDPCTKYPPGHILRPWWCDPVPPDLTYYNLSPCEGSGYNYYIREDHVCAILGGVAPCDLRGYVLRVKENGVGPVRCYRIGNTPTDALQGVSADAWIVGGPYPTCSDCGGDKVRLRDCLGQEPDKITNAAHASWPAPYTQLSDLIGKTIKIDGSDACWRVIATAVVPPDTNGDGEPDYADVTINTVLESCSDPACPSPIYELESCSSPGTPGSFKYVDDASTDFSNLGITSWASVPPGKVANLSPGPDNDCWEMKGYGDGTVEPVTVYEVKDNCDDCAPDCSDRTTSVGTYTPGGTAVLCGDPDAKPTCDTSDGCREIRRRAYCDRYCEYCYDGAGTWTFVDAWYISRPTGERVSAGCNCPISDADLDTMLLGAGGSLDNPYRMVVHVVHKRWECKWRTPCHPQGEPWVIASGPSWGELSSATLYA